VVQYPRNGISDYIREIKSSAIGEALAKAGLHQGEQSQRESDAPKQGEARVIMSRDELHSIAWLPDYGLRAWTMRSKKFAAQEVAGDLHRPVATDNSHTQVSG